MSLEIGSRIDRFVVEEQLGEGATATVFRVRDERTGTIHALKVMRVMSRRIGARIVREAEAQAKLRHPNVVGLHELLRIGGLPALVLEYVAGPSLDRVVRAGLLSRSQVHRLACDILRGVGAAHDAGLVHRDLKPPNVLVDLRDGTALAKVGDFGLAKALDASEGGRLLTRSGISMGTPRYMAPEQFRSARDADHRADLFALGAVLYELVTGTRAFDAKGDLAELYARTSSGAFVPLDVAAPGTPASWVDAVHRALRPRPEDRPPSAASMLELWTASGTASDEAWDAPTLERLETLPRVDAGGPSVTDAMPSPTWTTATPAAPSARAHAPGWLRRILGWR